MGDLLLRLPLSLFAWREGGRGRNARRWDRASAPGASPKIRSRSSTSDLMTSRSILPRSAGWHRVHHRAVIKRQLSTSTFGHGGQKVIHASQPEQLLDSRLGSD